MTISWKFPSPMSDTPLLLVQSASILQEFQALPKTSSTTRSSSVVEPHPRVSSKLKNAEEPKVAWVFIPLKSVILDGQGKMERFRAPKNIHSKARFSSVATSRFCWARKKIIS